MLAPSAAFADETPAPAASAIPEVAAAPASEMTIETAAEETPVETAPETPDEAFAAEPEAEAAPVEISDAIGIDITVMPHQLVVDSTAKFNLFNSDGELVGTAEEWIGGETTDIRLQFSVPAYVVGSEFTLGLVSGLRSLKYYDMEIAPGGSFTLGTYCFTNDAGETLHGNNFAMAAEPNFLQAVNFYYDGKNIALWPPGQVIDGVSMVSAYDIGKALGLKVNYNANYNSLTMAVGSQQIIFNMGGAYATFFGKDRYATHEPLWYGDAILVPAKEVLEAFGCPLDFWIGEDHVDVIAGRSSVVTEFRNKERVNREGIGSKTNYLVWVSKSNYQVKVYQGSRYNWECIFTAPCAIGAPGTPTIEGQFEFLYRGGTWDYPNFYVSPTLVFYGGYALHSTLKAYGGGMYDDRVGIQISHGCVRLHPSDINWINNTIPIGTRVYVTG